MTSWVRKLHLHPFKILKCCLGDTDLVSHHFFSTFFLSSPKHDRGKQKTTRSPNAFYSHEWVKKILRIPRGNTTCHQREYIYISNSHHGCHEPLKTCRRCTHTRVHVPRFVNKQQQQSEYCTLPFGVLHNTSALASSGFSHIFFLSLSLSLLLSVFLSLSPKPRLPSPTLHPPHFVDQH
jgi:hypothetical protein